MNEKQDRRRQNRVQGGFNQQRKPLRKSLPCNQQGGWHASSPPENSVVPSGSKWENLRQPTAGQPTIQRTRWSLDAPLVYKEPTETLREKPKVRIIENEGRHLLSDGPTGESWIHFNPTFLDPSMEDEVFRVLLREIKWESTSITIGNNVYRSPRLVKWFGPLPYSYSKVTLPANEEWHPAVLRILEAVQEQLKVDFNSVLLNLYEHEKHSVDWHSDDEMSMGVHPTIASVSLGQTRRFEFRKKPPQDDAGNYEFMEHVNVTLPGGSLIVMGGTTQQDWQHRAPKEFHSRKPRINLTFRTIY